MNTNPSPPSREPWQIRCTEYEVGMIRPDKPTQGDTGWFSLVSQSVRRAWEQEAEPAVFWRFVNADICDHDDPAATRAVLEALSQPAAAGKWREGSGFIDAHDARALPLERCAGRVPFDGMRFTGYSANEEWDYWFVWNHGRVGVAGMSHFHIVRDALRRGEHVPLEVVRDYRDLLLGHLDDTTVTAIPTVREALLEVVADQGACWKDCALAYLRSAPGQDYAAAGVHLAQQCPDQAVEIFARVMHKMPMLLTPEAVAALLEHGSPDTRRRAVMASTYLTG